MPQSLQLCCSSCAYGPVTFWVLKSRTEPLNCFQNAQSLNVPEEVWVLLSRRKLTKYVVCVPGVKPIPPNTDLEWQLILTCVSGLGPSHDLML